MVGRCVRYWNSLFSGDIRSFSPRKLQHTPRAHPRQSPWPTMKGIPAYSLLVKVFSGCVPVRCVETTLDISYQRSLAGISKGRWPWVQYNYWWQIWCTIWYGILFDQKSLSKILGPSPFFSTTDLPQLWPFGVPQDHGYGYSTYPPP